MEIPHDGPYADLVWSDPDQIETWVMSNRYITKLKRSWMAIWI